MGSTRTEAETDLQDRSCLPDEPLLSPKRVLRAVEWWLWYDYHKWRDGQPNRITLWEMVRGYHRPYANRKRY